MTYGLVLSAESLRASEHPDEEAVRRVRKATNWLIEHRDADGDDFLGWGLPQAWDAFGDETENPANHQYAITNAIVIQGLLDALEIPNFWSVAEREIIVETLRDVSVQYCKRAWTGDGTSGFFWYSPSPNDAYFVPNVNSMFLGTLSRFISDHREELTTNEQRFLQERADAAARSMVEQARMYSGLPYWPYLAVPNDLALDRPEDLLHHAYSLYGMELYRARGGTVKLPWTPDEAEKSFAAFWRGGKIMEFPRHADSANDGPARLWATGATLAFYARWGSSENAERTLDAISRDYGSFPNLRLYPKGFSQDETFYARHAAHVLWGLGLEAF